MILLDFSNIIIGSIMIAHKTSDQDAASEDFIRHLVLNSIRNYRVKYRAKYGEIVIDEIKKINKTFLNGILQKKNK